MRECAAKLQRRVAFETSLLIDTEARRRQRARLKSDQPALKRLGGLTIHHLVGAAPELFRAAATLPYTRRGLEVVGLGGGATVLRDPNGGVMKIIRESRHVPPEVQAAMKEDYERLILANTAVHESALPTEVVIGKDPVGEENVVMLMQDYIEPDRKKPNDVNRQYADFARLSLRGMIPEGYLPDVLGADNLIFSKGELQLVDTVAVPAASKDFGDQEAKLSRMLAEAAAV